MVFKSLVFVTLSKDVQVAKKARQRSRLAGALDSQCGGPGFEPRSDHQLVYCQLFPSSQTQGHSVGSGEKAGRKFSSTGKRAPGYRLTPNYFQNFKRMPAPDWAQKMLCIIVPNRRTVSPEFFSWARTRRLLPGSFIKLGRTRKTSIFYFPNQKRRNYR